MNTTIRKYLGHGQGNRRVRITRDGRITYYGSTDHYDRSHDYWHDGGTVEAIAAEIERDREEINSRRA